MKQKNIVRVVAVVGVIGIILGALLPLLSGGY